MKKLAFLLTLVAALSCNPTTIRTDFMDIQTLSGEPFQISSLQGKPIFLNVWATWCRPCVEEFPSINNLKAEFEKEGWQFVIVSDENAEKIKGFQRRNNFQFDYYRMNKRMQDFGITSIPQTYIIDRSGEVVMSYTGSTAWDSDKMKDELRNLVK